MARRSAPKFGGSSAASRKASAGLKAQRSRDRSSLKAPKGARRIGGQRRDGKGRFA